jgi:hypothetical protein
MSKWIDFEDWIINHFKGQGKKKAIKYMEIFRNLDAYDLCNSHLTLDSKEGIYP